MWEAGRAGRWSRELAEAAVACVGGGADGRTLGLSGSGESSCQSFPRCAHIVCMSVHDAGGTVSRMKCIYRWIRLRGQASAQCNGVNV